MDHKDMLRLIDTTPGFHRRATGAGHYAVYRDDRWVATIGKTPSKSNRALKNSLSQLASAGLEIPGKQRKKQKGRKLHG